MRGSQDASAKIHHFAVQTQRSAGSAGDLPPKGTEPLLQAGAAPDRAGSTPFDVRTSPSQEPENRTNGEPSLESGASEASNLLFSELFAAEVLMVRCRIPSTFMDSRRGHEPPATKQGGAARRHFGRLSGVQSHINVARKSHLDAAWARKTFPGAERSTDLLITLLGRRMLQQLATTR